MREMPLLLTGPRQVGATVVEMLNTPVDTLRVAACGVFGVYCMLTTEEELWNLLNAVILVEAPSAEARHGQMGALKGIAEHANARPAVEDRREDIVGHVRAYLKDNSADGVERLSVQSMAVAAGGALVTAATEGAGEETKRELLGALVTAGEADKLDLKATSPFPGVPPGVVQVGVAAPSDLCAGGSARPDVNKWTY
jgi:hypothetical protein